MPITMNDLFRGRIADEYGRRALAKYCEERQLTGAQLNLEWAKEDHRKTTEARNSFARWIRRTYPSAAATIMSNMWPGGNAVEDLLELQQSLWSRFLRDTKWAPPAQKRQPSKMATTGGSESAAPEPSLEDLDLGEIEILVQCALDEALDTLEGIHTDGDFLVRMLRNELDHTVDPVSRTAPAPPNFANLSAAFRKILFRAHAAFMVWSRMLEVLEILEEPRLEIRSGSDLVAACTKNADLFWDVFSMVTNMHTLILKVQGPELMYAFAAIPHFESAFDRVPAVRPSSEGPVNRGPSPTRPSDHSPSTMNLPLPKYLVSQFCIHFRTVPDIGWQLPLVQYFECCTPEERSGLPEHILDMLGRLAPTLYILHFLSHQLEGRLRHPIAVMLWDLHGEFVQSNPLAPPPDNDQAGAYDHSLLQAATIQSKVFDPAKKNGQEGSIPFWIVQQELTMLERVLNEITVPATLKTAQVLQQPSERARFWTSVSRSIMDACERHNLKDSFLRGAEFSFYVHMTSSKPASVSASAVGDTVLVPQKKQIIPVPRKQAKLFRKIFSDTPPANIKWSELENAMRASGFDVVPIAGTAVRFRPRDERDRPVVLYRPHPGKELSPLKVKEVARVLGRKYGWTADTFAEG